MGLMAYGLGLLLAHLRVALVRDAQCFLWFDRVLS